MSVFGRPSRFRAESLPGERGPHRARRPENDEAAGMMAFAKYVRASFPAMG
jgi:hypothetical protein